MKHTLLLLCLLLTYSCFSFAQNTTTAETEVKETINQLFRGMKNGDSALTRGAFASNCIMQTIAKNKDGQAMVKTEQLNGFLEFVGTKHNNVFDERIVFTKILIDGNLASVWTDYKFYVDDKFSHCGVNSFQLFKSDKGWKIIYLIDTRRKDSCN